jgi:hypothetical protein
LLATRERFPVLPDPARQSLCARRSLRNGESGALISAKDETIRVLHEQLEAEREAYREARRIIAGLVQRIPELQAPEEAPESPLLRPDRPGTSEDPAEAQEGAEHVSWWRRVFGG